MANILHADVLVAEIGSTTTLVNAFSDLDHEPRWLGQGQAPTTVLQGDVCVGLRNAVSDLSNKLGADVQATEMLATSSAAGGLSMTVHGLVYDMTVKAAQAAALGAGAVIRHATAGKLSEFDIEDIKAISPKLILLAGGTDYGERATAVYNAQMLLDNEVRVPAIFAGNVQCQRKVEKMYAEAGVPLYVTENVYPRLDAINIEPARRIIQRVFAEHIVRAPGMEKISEMVQAPILPTPGAVMEAAKRMYEQYGDLAVIDVGGATTDVHSVTPGSENIALMATGPEPMAKRTVEGDLGLYVNAGNLVRQIGESALSQELGIDVPEVMRCYLPIPETAEQFKLTCRLCWEAASVALQRHCGVLRHLYSPSGRRTVAEGKDLSELKYLVATGGALTRLPQRREIMRRLADMNVSGMMLLPAPGKIQLLFDDNYIMASLGVLSQSYPEAASQLMSSCLKP
ncbi:MAG: GlmL-related ornithine degradation protein [bacterium]|nr:GlmL-related ornithine degradation protein [bacterium]